MSLFVFIASIGVWLGMVVSFSFAFLPTIQQLLSSSVSEMLLPRLLFRYNVIGILCGLSALAAVSLAPADTVLTASERLRLAFPVSVALVCALVMQYSLLPRMTQLRDASSSPAYRRMRRISAQLNVLILGMLLLSVAALAAR